MTRTTTRPRTTMSARSTLAIGLAVAFLGSACGSSTEELDQADPPTRFQDPLRDEQWGLSATRVPEAWEVAAGRAW